MTDKLVKKFKAEEKLLYHTVVFLGLCVTLTLTERSEIATFLAAWFESMFVACLRPVASREKQNGVVFLVFGGVSVVGFFS